MSLSPAELDPVPQGSFKQLGTMEGGGGGGPRPPTHNPPPLLKDSAKFSPGPSVNQKFSFGAFGDNWFQRKIFFGASKTSAPLGRGTD